MAKGCCHSSDTTNAWSVIASSDSSPFVHHAQRELHLARLRKACAKGARAEGWGIPDDRIYFGIMENTMETTIYGKEHGNYYNGKSNGKEI